MQVSPSCLRQDVTCSIEKENSLLKRPSTEILPLYPFLLLNSIENIRRPGFEGYIVFVILQANGTCLTVTGAVVGPFKSLRFKALNGTVTIIDRCANYHQTPELLTPSLDIKKPVSK